ncbi:MAG: hypothetical protein ABIH23_05620, partial [bacterium]
MSNSDSTVTHRERFRRCMHYQTVDRIPHWEFGYWNECFEKWHTQGLPKHLNSNEAVESYFGCEHIYGLPDPVGLMPPFEREVLEDRSETQLVKNEDGVIAEVYTSGTSTIPHYLEFPIKNRKTWEEFKERLDPNNPNRYAYDIEKIKAEARLSTDPVCINIGSMFGRLRDWTGFEQICYLIYDDRDLVEEMVEHMCQLVLRVIEPLAQEVEIDAGWGWEDICF